jgi:hypothetical protein
MSFCQHTCFWYVRMNRADTLLSSYFWVQFEFKLSNFFEFNPPKYKEYWTIIFIINTFPSNTDARLLWLLVYKTRFYVTVSRENFARRLCQDLSPIVLQAVCFNYPCRRMLAFNCQLTNFALYHLAYSASFLHYISSNYAVLEPKTVSIPFLLFWFLTYLMSAFQSLKYPSGKELRNLWEKANYYAFALLNSYSKLHCSYFNNCYFVTLYIVAPHWISHILIQSTCFGIIVSSSALVCKPLTVQCTTVCAERTKR